jgi:hypothetical protein
MSYKTVIINEEDECNVTVVVNDKAPQFDEINDLLNIAIGLYQTKIDTVVNNVIANSALYLNPEEVEEVNLMQTLTGKWMETAEEMDTIQQNFSGGWQEVTEYIQDGVVDAGFF